MSTYNKLKQVYDDLGLETSPESIDGQVITYNSMLVDDLQDQIDELSKSNNLNDAQGQALKSLGTLVNVRAKVATASTATLQITGSGTVPQGAVFASSVDGTQWIADAQSTGSVDVTCQTLGAITAASDTITTIVTPIVGVDAVTNANAAVPGRDNETDTQLRARIRQSGASRAAGTASAIEAALAQIDELTHLRVHENPEPITKTMPGSSETMAAHSIAIFYLGSDINTIAQTALPVLGFADLNHDSGLSGKQNTTVRTPIRVINGREIGGQELRFTAFEVQPVDLTITIAIRDAVHGYTFTEASIKKAINEFANATLFQGQSAELGFDRTGFEIGESVSKYDLATPVLKAIGGEAKIDSITVLHGTIAYNQVANIDDNKITITVSH
jgi:hypothetical protein